MEICKEQEIKLTCSSNDRNIKLLFLYSNGNMKLTLWIRVCQTPVLFVKFILEKVQ